MIYNQTIKDFEPDSTAYLVYRERLNEYTIKEVTVESVGRKYVKLKYNPIKYSQENTKTGAFTFSEYYNDELLFCNEVLAQICLERIKAISKIRDLSYNYNYDLLPLEDLACLISIYKSGLRNRE